MIFAATRAQIWQRYAQRWSDGVCGWLIRYPWGAGIKNNRVFAVSIECNRQCHNTLPSETDVKYALIGRSMKSAK